MKIALAVIGPIVGVLLLGSVLMFARNRTLGPLVQLVGALFLVVVVLAHVAEEFHWLSGMGWGLPNSPGHYLNLTSVILGLILVPLGYALARRTRSKRGRAER